MPITTAADLWSLGCIIYQMISGRYPFRGKSDMLTFEKVKSRDFFMPPNMPPRAADLINKLLVLKPADRLGAGPNFAALKAHPFFEGLQFDGLWNQPPPPMAPLPFALIFPDESPTPSPVTPGVPAPSATAAAAAVPGSPATAPKQPEKWREFLKPGEEVIEAGLVIKRKHLSTKRRFLILTKTPRLLYVSFRTMELKGEIPWTLSTAFGMSKAPANFFVQDGKRKYNFEDPQKNAARWIVSFEEAMRIHRGGAVPESPK